MKRPTQGAARGFSLLELLVAFSILSLSLGLLYKAAGGVVRNVGDLDTQNQASALALSLLHSNDALDPSGWNESGATEAFAWQVRSRPYGGGTGGAEQVPFHAVSISIRAHAPPYREYVALQTLLPVRQPPPGASMP